jgi:hypothetical protein
MLFSVVSLLFCCFIPFGNLELNFEIVVGPKLSAVAVIPNSICKALVNA